MKGAQVVKTFIADVKNKKERAEGMVANTVVTAQPGDVMAVANPAAFSENIGGPAGAA